MLVLYLLASSSLFECMRVTASRKPGRKYALMKKRALIRKVHLTTRVYGSLTLITSNPSFLMLNPIRTLSGSEGDFFLVSVWLSIPASPSLSMAAKPVRFTGRL